MMKEFIFPIHVYLNDTDASGVVYHANFLIYLERARSTWCNLIGAPLVELAKQNIFFVVRAVELEYLAPARLNDDLEVVSRIEQLGRTSVSFQQEVRFAERKEKILCKGRVVVVCINETLKPRVLPNEILEALAHGN